MGSKPFSQYSYEKRDPTTGEEPNDLTLFMMTHMRNGTWTNAASMDVYERTSQKVHAREFEEDRLLTSEEENIVFQTTYKEITGCKTSKPHGHGYLAKYPSRREFMNAQIEEDARVSAAIQQKNIELEGKVEKLEEKLAKRDKIFEEKTLQIREEEKQAREELRQQLMAGMVTIIAKEREDPSQKSTAESTISTEVPEVRKTGTTKVNQKTNATATYISPHQLICTANKSRVRPREEI